MRGKKVVTESPEELLVMANAQIRGAEGRLNSEYEFDNPERIMAASCLTLATEYILKAYLKTNNITVFQGHDLNDYFLQILNIDETFKHIDNNIGNLNKYDPSRKYSNTLYVDNNTFNNNLIDMKIIYYFKPIELLYDDLVKKEICMKLPVQRFDDMIRRFNDIISKNEVKEMECLKHEYFNDAAKVNIPENRINLINMRYIKIPGKESSVEENLIKHQYKNEKGQDKYYLEKRYRNNIQEIFQADLWQINHDFNDVSALEFVRQYNEGKRHQRP